MSTSSGAATQGTHARIVVAADQQETRDALARHLGQLGYSVVGGVSAIHELVDRTRELTPDLVLIDLQALNGSVFDSLEQLAHECPAVAVVVLTADAGIAFTDPQLARTTAFGVLPQASSPRVIDSALRVVLHRARELRAARDEAISLKTQLENRKAIERAKGILMRRTGLSEQEAYRILQRTSQDRSVPMAAVAKEVLDSEPGR